MTQHPSCDEGAPSSRRPHSGEEKNVDDAAEWVSGVLPVVPTARGRIRIRIDHLPEDLDRRLRAVGFLVRHVQIVHHQEAHLPCWGAIDALPPAIQLRIDEVLRLRALRLCRESHDDLHVAVLVQIEQGLLHVSRLAGACWPTEQQFDLVLDAMVQHVSVSNIVLRLDDQRLHGRPRLDHLRLHGVQPRLPSKMLRREDPIEYRATLWHLRGNFLELLDSLDFALDEQSDVRAEHRPGSSHTDRAKGPNATEDAEAIDGGDDVLLRGGFIVGRLLQVWQLDRILQVRQEHQHEALHEIRILRRRDLLALLSHEVEQMLEEPPGHVPHLRDLLLIQ
mmetsp:Transcript_24989/g.71814  ORF Transcript_24989/g.71814 Transcript_24989/m.71814 type:complete len:335 (-) Transcript_24989:852-1856(-)